MRLVQSATPVFSKFLKTGVFIYPISHFQKNEFRFSYNKKVLNVHSLVVHTLYLSKLANR